MNKFQVAYYVSLVLLALTLIAIVGVAVLPGAGIEAALGTFWLPLLVSGILVYALRDWKSCSVEVKPASA